MSKILCGVLSAMLSTCVMAADGIVLAVPARQMLLNFGFDLMEMVPDRIDLVCYGTRSGDDDAASMEIDLFDPLEGRWGVLDRESWTIGEGLRSGTKTLFVMGSGAMSEAIQRVDWTRDVRVFPGGRLDGIANAAGTELAFTPKQWHAIAKKYGFTIEDHNAELRRIGRRRMKARQSAKEARPATPSYPPVAVGEIPTIDAPVAERRTSVLVMPLADIQAAKEAAAKPVEESPAIATPAVEAPAVEVPAPAVEAPAINILAPAVEASKAEAPAIEIVPVVPAAETPRTDVPAAEAEAPAAAVPAAEVPAATPAEPAAAAPAQEPAVPMIVIRPVADGE